MKFKILLSLMLFTISAASTAQLFLKEKTGVKECDDMILAFYSCQAKNLGDAEMADSLALMMVGQHRGLMKGRNAIPKEEMKKGCIAGAKKIRTEGCKR